MDFSLILQSASLVRAVATYFGYIQDKQDAIALQLQRLADSELEAGLRALEQASASESEQRFLLREARSRFNKAISLEHNLRLVVSYLGLAICHRYLSDEANSLNAIRRMLQVEYIERSLVQRLSNAKEPSPSHRDLLQLQIEALSSLNAPKTLISLYRAKGTQRCPECRTIVGWDGKQCRYCKVAYEIILDEFFTRLNDLPR